MNALKFNLSGKTAFFKKGDVNQNILFTYGNIHKITILGILGAIIGLKGYSHQKHDKSNYLEFYEYLKHLKISIVPHSKNSGYFVKKIQNYNNTTGLASKENGGNLIVREQWLYDVEWDIFIIDDHSEAFNKIKYYLTNNLCEYIPYLGRNDHYANIKDVQYIEIVKNERPEYFSSLFLTEEYGIKLDCLTYDESEEFRYSEYLPCELDKETMYVTKLLTLTNLLITYDGTIENSYSYGNINLMFF